MLGTTEYCICGNYYLGNEKCTYYRQYFLGTEGPCKIFIYDESPNERTLKFNSKREAENYIEARDSLKSGGICTHGKHYVVEVWRN